MNNASRHLNAQGSSAALRYRAEVNDDGSVALIADTPGTPVAIRGAEQDTATTIQLTADQFQNLQQMADAPDKKLMYIDGQFVAKTIGTVN